MRTEAAVHASSKGHVRLIGLRNDVAWPIEFGEVARG